MAQRPTDYAQFRAFVDPQYNALVLPADCKEILALDIKVATSVSWHLSWLLEFTDNKYIRVAERYEKFAKLIGVSRRIYVAYHYGEIVNRNMDGLPGYLSADPVDIRIDSSCSPIHLHYNAPNPHYPNDSVQGLDLDDMDMFTFVNGIFKHRSTKKPLDKIFKFKI
ncbi:MAG: hypothetical protein ACRD51_00850 [Candidatus Acidiferrum sp.]